ncbi:hypothetical protein ACFVMC_11255 [Nocardia sp. NPDC127579]|uniref:hypothetical protein n=1 Tax=Nocardia sp. NPDC127579 TaxID=3345402 RepID=UPI00362D5203
MVFLAIIGAIGVIGAVLGFVAGNIGFGFSCLGLAAAMAIIAYFVHAPDVDNVRARRRRGSESWSAGGGSVGFGGDSGSSGGDSGSGCGGGGGGCGGGS